jgi:MurNAc alpha-1-phosphate uridylyltransferase
MLAMGGGLGCGSGTRPTALGLWAPAGALRAVIDSAALVGENFGVINGDSYLSLDLAQVEAAFEEERLPSPDDRDAKPGSVGRQQCRVSRRAGDRVRQVPPRGSGVSRMEWIDYGFAILSRSAVTDRVAAGEVAELSDLMRELSAAGQLAGQEVHERFYEIGSPSGLADLGRHLASGGNDRYPR